MSPDDPSPHHLALLGVRHHGPGSARRVRAALEQFKPDIVLVEGPPEADAVVGLAAETGMRPPVALLAHATDPGSVATGAPERATDAPRAAAFWPFPEFSPEWVAIRHALDQGVPVRFIDLPAANVFGLAAERARRYHRARPETPGDPMESTPGDTPSPDPDPVAPEQPTAACPDQMSAGDGAGEQPAPPTTDRPAGEPVGRDAPDAEQIRFDPIAVLARAAGQDDAERWWDDAIEHHAVDDDGDALAPFTALAEAMGVLRHRYGHLDQENDPAREAHMRLRIKQASREFDRVAVVCGAWHVPALAARTTQAADRRILKGLPKTRVEVTWVPWTHQRLGQHSGYGAGVASPGWYHHLFTAPDRPIARWMTTIARLLREEDHPISSAHVIEAVRLAETLAGVRGRPLAGLTETMDAVRAVMCDGSDVPLRLIHDRLVVGHDLGEVPDSAPAVPLQRDLSRIQRALRLKPEALARDLALDLREDNDGARSRLLHRLRLLGVNWGEPVPAPGGTGTFREAWRLCWEPELTVRVAEAGIWGITVVSAATAKAEEEASRSRSLAEVTTLAERCLLAELPEALPTVMRVLADRAALDTDVSQLAAALPALVRSVRYGTVRGTDAGALREVAEGLAVRLCIGMPPACLGLDEDGARAMRIHLDAVHQAVGLLDREGLRNRWASMLTSLANREAADAVFTIPGLLRGRAARLLLDDGRMDIAEAARLMGLTLTPGSPPADAAAWIEGFLAGGGMLLVHDERLLSLLDAWLTGVPAQSFTDVLPLLRRTFAEFPSGVRRALGDLVRRAAHLDRPGRADPGGGAAGFAVDRDDRAADAVLPALRLLLGLDPRRGGTTEPPGATPGGSPGPAAGPGTANAALVTDLVGRPDRAAHPPLTGAPRPAHGPGTVPADTSPGPYRRCDGRGAAREGDQ